MKNSKRVKYMTDDQIREIWERIGKDEEDWQKWLQEEYAEEECETCKINWEGNE